MGFTSCFYFTSNKEKSGQQNVVSPNNKSDRTKFIDIKPENGVINPNERN